MFAWLRKSKSEEPAPPPPPASEHECVDVLCAIRDRVSSMPAYSEKRFPLRAFYRFYRAQKFDAASTEAVIREFFEWRTKCDVDTVLDAPLPRWDEVQALHPYGWHGEGRDGHPCFFDRFGMCDPGSFVEIFSSEEAHRHHMWVLEQGRFLGEQNSAKHGRCIEGSIQIYDLKGFGRKNFNMKALDLIKEFTRIEQRFYPDLLHKFFLVNASWLFTAFWKFFSLWLDPTTKAKFIILGEDYHAKLGEYVAADQLPSFLGGTCTACHGDCLPFGTDGPAAQIRAAAAAADAAASVAVAAAATEPSALSSTLSASSAHGAEPGGSSNSDVGGSGISDASLSEAQRAEALALAAAGFGGDATQFSVANQ